MTRYLPICSMAMVGLSPFMQASILLCCRTVRPILAAARTSSPLDQHECANLIPCGCLNLSSPRQFSIRMGIENGSKHLNKRQARNVFKRAADTSTALEECAIASELARIRGGGSAISATCAVVWVIFADRQISGHSFNGQGYKRHIAALHLELHQVSGSHIADLTRNPKETGLLNLPLNASGRSNYHRDARSKLVVRCMRCPHN